MNLRHPYEQLIADKLKKLPVPDAEASWQQMKRLLDDDQDTGAGGKRPPGNNGWWRIGIIAIVLSASLWLYVEKTMAPGASLSKANTTSTNNKTAAIKSSSATNSATTSNNNQTTVIDNTTTLPVSNANTVTVKANDKTGNATIAGKSTLAGIEKINTIASGNTITPLTAVKDAATANNLTTPNGNTKNNTVKKPSPIVGKRDEKNNGLALNQSSVQKEHTRIKNNGQAYTIGNSINDNNDIAGDEKNNPLTSGHIIAAASYTSHNNSSKQKKHTTKFNSNTDNVQDERRTFAAANNHTKHYTNSKSAGNPYLPFNQDAVAKEDPWHERLNQLKVSGTAPTSNTALLSADSAAHNRNINNLLNPETKKLSAKAQRDKELALEEKKDKKLLHLNLSNLFKPFSLHMDAEPRWAAGIALNSGVTLNAQNRYNYNMNAKSNTLSDYVPSVYLQFHLNDYVYAQTEINFVSPQYTPQLLVYQQNNLAAQPGTSVQKSIYVEKLYYFSLPVSLHYSPVNNLYFSAGLQFSSFQSGLASIQEKQYVTQAGLDHPSAISNTILKFKDDSIAATIAPNEWRWQAGAEYYWNHFTVGLRYNQAFKQAMNVNVNSTLPPTVMRNQSLLFFMRYNLFESRKKGETAQKN